MKKILVSIFAMSSMLTASAQTSLFKTVSTTDQYKAYHSVRDNEGDGTYVIKDLSYIVKFKTAFLPTGEGIKLTAINDNDKDAANKGKLLSYFDAAEENVMCVGSPYESMLLNTKDNKGFVAIGDYAFVIGGVNDEGTSFKYIYKVYIKNGATSPANAAKKKSTLKEKLLALKALKSGGAVYGAEHRALQSQNLNTLITDYLVAMKAKQDGRTSAEKQNAEKNYKKAKDRAIQAEKDEWAEAKRYNDSIKATPEYQDLERRKRQNEANYQASKAQNDVTLRNNGSSAIYVGTSHSTNRGTEISAGGTARWSCSEDAYIQIETVKGSTYTYKASSHKVYRANSGCGNTVNIN
ncbi:MAG: hypothetical protein ACPGTG_07925 [Flavobacteriales bacterium]